MGKPVIGSTLGGIPELVQDHVTGLTFQAGDAQGLRSKIEYLMDRPDEAKRMGLDAQARVQRQYNTDKHYGELMKIYNEAIGSKSIDR